LYVLKKHLEAVYRLVPMWITWRWRHL